MSHVSSSAFAQARASAQGLLKACLGRLTLFTQRDTVETNLSSNHQRLTRAPKTPLLLRPGIPNLLLLHIYRYEDSNLG